MPSRVKSSSTPRLHWSTTVSTRNARPSISAPWMNHTPPLAATDRYRRGAAMCLAQHVLEGEISDDLFQAPILLLERAEYPQLTHAQAREALLPHLERRVGSRTVRHTSATAVPHSACRSAYEIWSPRTSTSWPNPSYHQGMLHLTRYRRVPCFQKATECHPCDTPNDKRPQA